MSKGNDGRTHSEKDGRNRSSLNSGPKPGSRTSIPMTAERARAIQAHADKTGCNQDFKARAMSAAERNEAEQEETETGTDEEETP